MLSTSTPDSGALQAAKTLKLFELPQACLRWPWVYSWVQVYINKILSLFLPAPSRCDRTYRLTTR